MKKILVLILALSMICALFAGCGGEEPSNGDEPSDGGKTVKVGLICIGDENDQVYTDNFIRGK